MVTRLKQRQISSSVAGKTELSEQLSFLESRATDNEYALNQLSFIKGKVMTKSELPTSQNMHGDIWLVANEANIYQWDDFIGDWVNASSKPDPVLGDRLTSLENVTETFVNTYVENFTAPNVDTVNTTAIVGQGYVKPGKNFVFETFDNTSMYDDINSSGVKTSQGKLTLSSGVNGVYYSKTTTSSSDITSAIIEPTNNNYTAYCWTQTSNIAGKGTGTKYTKLIDSNNRIWYVYGGGTGGNVFYKIYNSNGTVYKNETAISGTNHGTVGQAPVQVQNIAATFDGAGNLWILYHYNTGNPNYWSYIYYCAIKPDYTMLVNQTALYNNTSSVGGNGAYPYAGGAVTDNSGRVWFVWGHNTSSNLNHPYYAGFNTNGTAFFSAAAITGLSYTGTGTYQSKVVFDPTRNKIDIIQLHTDNYLYTAAFDNNGNVLRSFTNTNVMVDKTELDAIYDPDFDQVVIFATGYRQSGFTNGALKVVKVSGATLDYISQYDLPGLNAGCGSLARPSGNAKSASTNSALAASASASKALDGGINYGYSGYGWGSNASEVSWVYWMVDLGAVMPVGMIRVWNGWRADTYNEAWAKSFTVAISTDGVGWTDVQSFTNTGETNYDTWLGANSLARYVKVYKFGNLYNSFGAGLQEVEVYPPLGIDRLVSYANAGTGVASTGTTAVKRGNQYFLSYPSVRYNGTYPTVCTAIIDAGTMAVLSADNVLSAIGVTATRPSPYVHPDGTIRVAYMTSDGAISEGTYQSSSTAVSYYLSNNNGTTWLQATPGQRLDFAGADTRLKVKITMTAPIATMTPEVLDYLVRFWNTSTPTSVTSTFTTGKLPAVQAISKAVITAVQNLNGGTIAWYMSNNGGMTWMAATLGQQIVFNNLIGPDLRVKAVLQCNLTDPLPTITQFTLLTSEMASAIDIHDVQTNLMKTNFKLDSHTNASKNSMKNLIIDVFNDTTGIDAAKSTYTFDSTNKCVSGTIVQSSADTTATVPVNILLTVDEVPGTGTLTYMVSRDGGTTWTGIVPGMVASISSQPVGTSLVMKVQFTGNAKLNAWAYAWS